MKRSGGIPPEIIRSLRLSIPKLVSRGLPDPWSSAGAFTEVVGRYGEAGVNEFVIDQPRPDQYQVAERIASEIIGQSG